MSGVVAPGDAVSFFVYTRFPHARRLVHSSVRTLLVQARFTVEVDDRRKTTVLREDEEGTTWVRGHHAEDSNAMKALAVADALAP